MIDGEERPIAFASRSLTKAESQYIEKQQLFTGLLNVHLKENVPLLSTIAPYYTYLIEINTNFDL